MIRADAAPIVVLSPHLDDAAYSCFHVLASGEPVVVVNVFAGVPPVGTPTGVWGRLCGYEEASEYVNDRIHEDYAALSDLDVATVYLGFAESSARRTLGDPDPSVAAVLDEIEDAVERAKLVLAPLGGADRPHPDHELVRSAAVELLYAGIPVALYADFPHVCKARHAWPVELVDASSADGAVRVDPTVRWAKKLPGRVPEIDPLYGATVWILDDDERGRKRATMELYRSQFRPLDTKLRAKGLVSDPRLYGAEVAVPLLAR